MSADNRYTYAKAGVSIDAGNALVKAIGPLVKATRRPGADAEIGGFGGFFDPKAAGYSDPLLVAANDGVGTKLKLAIDCDRHDTVGIDLVAMCANDLIVQGAEPLFFLDYFATGKLDTGVAERVIAGIARGCTIAGCALTAIVYGLMTREKWNARFNPQADPEAPAGGTSWLTIFAIAAALMIGTGVLMASIAFSFQRYFEYQIEEGRKISQ